MALNWDVTDLLDFSVSRTGISTVKWNDEYFDTHFSFKISERVTAAIARLACKVFLRWYIGGILPSGVRLVDVYLAIMSKMTLPSGDHLFPDSLIANDSIVIGNLGTCGTESLKYINSHVQTLELTSTSTGSPITWNETTVIEWYNTILLFDEDVTSFSEKHKTLVNICGFLALTMLRSIVKDPDTVTRSMARTTSTNINNLWNLTIPECPPPNQISLISLGTVAKRGSHNANLLLSMVINAYRSGKTDPTIVGTFRAACLMSLSMNGINCIHWLISAARAMNVAPVMIAKCLATNCHLKTNKAILELMRGHITNKQTTWEWARLFHEGAFVDLSVKEDPLYVGTCFFLSEGIETSPSGYLSLAGYIKGNILENAKIKAMKIASYLRLQDLDTAQTDEAKKVAQTIVKMPEQVVIRSFPEPHIESEVITDTGDNF